MRWYNIKNRIRRAAVRPIVLIDLLMLAILIAGIIYGGHFFSYRPPFEQGNDAVSEWAFWTVIKSLGVIGYTIMFTGGYFVLRLMYIIMDKFFNKK